MCTAFLNLSGSLSATGFPSASSSLPFAVALENGAEIPAMAVVVGELGVFVLVVVVPDFFQKIQIAP